MCFDGSWTRDVVVFDHARIPSTRLDAEELHLHERVEHLPAERRIDAEQALRLFKGQSQAWHLEIFAPNTGDEWGMRHDEPLVLVYPPAGRNPPGTGRSRFTWTGSTRRLRVSGT